MLTVTLDIEDHRAGGPGPKRYRAMTEKLLDCLAARDVRATCFVVGDLVDSDAPLIRRIADAGHEIGLHSFDHRPLHVHRRDAFREATANARTRLEDLAGTAVVGYRAPSFSLTAETRWVTAVLPEIGFRYSSSVLPAKNPLFGDPTLPDTPFRWPSGLLEIPAPVTHFGPVALPYLGGIYFRYLPRAVIRRALARATGTEVLWSYLHPYDIDRDEPFCRPHGAPLWMSLLLWANRAHTLDRLTWLMDGADGATAVSPPFAARLTQDVFADAPALPSDDLA